MGFGNEVKDFLAAYQVTSGIKDRRRQRDIEQQRADNQVSIAKMKQDAYDKKWQADYGLRERAADRADELNKFNKEKFADESSLKRERLDFDKRRADATEKRLAAESARKLHDKAIAEDPTKLLDDESAEPPSQALPTGVNTGTVEETQEGEGPAQNQAIPTSPEPAAASSTSAPVSTPTVTGSGMGPVAPAVALAGGLKYIQEHFGLGKQQAVPTAGATEQGKKRLFEGEGSMTPEEQQAVDKMLDEQDIKNGVDPQKLTDSARSIRRLTRTYELLLSRGKTKEANQMAAAIIQSSRGTASMLGQQALGRLQKGDIQGAAQSVVQAHDQIPDGRSVKFDPNSMTFQVIDDQSGNVVQKGQATPEMIFSLANGFKDGSAYYAAITGAASRDPSMQDKPPTAAQAKEAAKEDELKAVPGYEPSDKADVDVNGSVIKEFARMKLPDGSPVFSKTLKAPMPGQEDVQGDMTPEEITKAIGEHSVTSITNLGAMISKYNDVSPAEAGRLAVSIVNPSVDSDQKWNFKLINGTQNVMEIMTEDGTRLRLPARTATAAIKAGHDGMFQLASKMDRSRRAEADTRAARLKQRDAVEVENQRRAKDALDEQATQAIEADALASVHGPNATPTNAQGAYVDPAKLTKYHRKQKEAGGQR